MNLEERTFEFMENLKAIKKRTFLTDAYKEQIHFTLELRNVNNELPYIEIFDEIDYKNVVDYIIKEIDNPSFNFRKSEYNSYNKYLVLSM